jgi:ATP-dependent Clp protease adaptor protein ClpS
MAGKPVNSPERRDDVLTPERQKGKKPPLYRVLLHNDDYTTQDFVVYILQVVFHREALEAERIMMAVHQQGIGIAGVYTREIAEAKIAKVTALAREQEHPLLCTMEEDG